MPNLVELRESAQDMIDFFKEHDIDTFGKLKSLERYKYGVKGKQEAMIILESAPQFCGINPRVITYYLMEGIPVLQIRMHPGLNYVYCETRSKSSIEGYSVMDRSDNIIRAGCIRTPCNFETVNRCLLEILGQREHTFVEDLATESSDVATIES